MATSAGASSAIRPPTSSSATICGRAYGVYAVRGRCLDDGSEHDGVANLGIRPMFDPPKELLEPYFFDFDGDLYGQTIEVELHPFLRAGGEVRQHRRAQGADATDATRRRHGELLA